jgi:hypothetical protein
VCKRLGGLHQSLCNILCNGVGTEKNVVLLVHFKGDG